MRIPRTDKGERRREEEQRHIGQGVHRDDAQRQLGHCHDPANQARWAVRPPRKQGLAEDVAAARHRYVFGSSDAKERRRRASGSICWHRRGP